MVFKVLRYVCWTGKKGPLRTHWNSIDDDISKDFKEFIDSIYANFESEDLLIKDWVGSKTYGEDDDKNISKISN